MRNREKELLSEKSAVKEQKQEVISFDYFLFFDDSVLYPSGLL